MFENDVAEFVGDKGWEVACNEIDSEKNIDYHARIEEQKRLLLSIFAEFCTERERKNSRPMTISYGTNGYFDYNIEQEEIVDVLEEKSNRIVVLTRREVPTLQKMQYVFLYKKGEWLIDSKKKFYKLKQKWESVSL